VITPRELSEKRKIAIKLREKGVPEYRGVRPQKSTFKKP